MPETIDMDGRPRTDGEDAFDRTGGTPLDDPGAPARLLRRRRRTP